MFQYTSPHFGASFIYLNQKKTADEWGDLMKYIFAVILAALMLTACGGNAGTIKIGFVGPLTGENAALGVPIQKGALLAAEEINAAGGINGKQIEIISEDGGCKGEPAAKAGNKLLAIDKVIAITGGMCSSETLAIAPMAEEAKTVLISPASTNPSITDAGDYVFRAISSDKFQAATMADHLISRNIRKTATIYANSDFNIGLNNAFKERYESLGGTVVAAETYEQDSKDFRTQLTKIRAANPDALFVIPYGEGGLILKQAREIGITAPFFGPDAIGGKAVIEQAGPVGEGLIFTEPKFDPANPKSREFVERFKAKYGEEPAFPGYTANNYDIIYLLADAIRKGGENRDAIKEYLYNVRDYDGAGGMLTLDENGDALKEFQLTMVKNGELVPYAEEKPAALPKPAPKPEPKVEPSDVETVEAKAPPPKPSTAQKIVVSVKEWEMQPGESYAKPGEVALQVVNRGSNTYTIEVVDREEQTVATTKPIAAGSSDTVTFSVTSGVYDLYDVEYGKTKDIHALLVVE